MLFNLLLLFAPGCLRNLFFSRLRLSLKILCPPLLGHLVRKFIVRRLYLCGQSLIPSLRNRFLRLRVVWEDLLRHLARCLDRIPCQWLERRLVRLDHARSRVNILRFQSATVSRLAAVEALAPEHIPGALAIELRQAFARYFTRRDLAVVQLASIAGACIGWQAEQRSVLLHS